MKELGFWISLAVLIGCIAAYAALVYIVAFQPFRKHKFFCCYCGEEIQPKDDHWCEKRIAWLKDFQCGSKWDGRCRRVIVLYRCSICGDYYKKNTVFDYSKNSLPDKQIIISGKCNTHKGYMT